MELAIGLEPTTTSLQVRSSTIELRQLTRRENILTSIFLINLYFQFFIFFIFNQICIIYSSYNCYNTCSSLLGGRNNEQIPDAFGMYGHI